jgi:hypothetical protein
MKKAREAEQVAKRAMILGAVSLRSSLEVTDHPRAVEIAGRLLPWLIEIGCDAELDPIERDLLQTDFGQLSESQKVDANWAGESARFFCWTLNLAPAPDPVAPARDDFVELLHVLRPQATDIVRSTSLRPRDEIIDACRQFALVRSLLQESRVESRAREIVRRVNVQRLNELGVEVTDDALARASTIVARMTPQQRSFAAGLYFVRCHAAMWFLSARATYFDPRE